MPRNDHSGEAWEGCAPFTKPFATSWCNMFAQMTLARGSRFQIQKQELHALLRDMKNPLVLDYHTGPYTALQGLHSKI